MPTLKHLAAAITLAACLAIPASSFAADTPAPAKKTDTVPNKAKRNGGPLGPVYSHWVKELALDEATQAKLAEISAKQEEANKPSFEKIKALNDAITADKAAGKHDDAKAKQTEIDKLRSQVSKSNTSFRAQAIALLTPEQHKKLTVSIAFKASPFSKVTLTPEQTKKVMDKLSASAADILNDNKEVDSKKLAPILKALAEEVLTPEQKAELSKPKEPKPTPAATDKK